MRPFGVVVSDEFLDQVLQMPFAEDHEVVEAFDR